MVDTYQARGYKTLPHDNPIANIERLGIIFFGILVTLSLTTSTAWENPGNPLEV